MRWAPSARFVPLFLLGAALGLSGGAAAKEAPPARIAVSAGGMASLDVSPSFVGIVEYRSAFNLLPASAELRPMIGLLGNTQGGIFGYGGVRLAFPLAPKWRYENALGIGGYRQGSGPELYSTLEFCLAVTLLMDVSQSSRVGIQLFHVSNGGTATKDPGANSLLAMFEFAVPGS